MRKEEITFALIGGACIALFYKSILILALGIVSLTGCSANDLPVVTDTARIKITSGGTTLKFKKIYVPQTGKHICFGDTDLGRSGIGFQVDCNDVFPDLVTD